MTVDADGCWIGPSPAFEALLAQPFPTYALEQLRARFMFALTTNHAPILSARVCLQFAFETEVGSILVKQIEKPADLLTSQICQRRHFIDIDQDMHQQRYLIGPALQALSQTPNMPAAYMEFMLRYLTSEYPRYRMCTLAVAICIAKVLTP